MGALNKIGRLQAAKVRRKRDTLTNVWEWRLWWLITPTKGAIKSQATTINPTPMKHIIIEVCNIRDMSEPAGKPV